MSPRKKIPTKAELIQLQKLYRTDEKIGERLGGVPAYLVAYWRRKKNVPRYSQPKFSESEVRNLWERYGDDDKCGLELGISKAAFYNWRRRYGIREKPAFLKLEQLELAFPGIKSNSRAASLYGKRTIAQKVLAQASESEKVEVGDTVVVEPDVVIAHGDVERIVSEFRRIGTEYVFNPSRLVIATGMCATDKSDGGGADERSVRDFARRQSIRAVYDFRHGACHQVAVENGHVLPGQLAVGLDDLTPIHGSLGTYSLTVTPEQMGRVWADGKVETTVPQSARIDISGRRARGVYARDIILTIAKRLGGDGVGGKTVEFFGSGVSRMSINERLTLTGLTPTFGARAGICPFDSTTRRYLTGRTTASYHPVLPDKDAEYTDLYQINIEQLVPQMARAGKSQEIRPVAEMEETPVQQVILGTCANGRFEDLRIAADVLKGKQVHPECLFLVHPASRTVYIEALKKGLIRVLTEAGAVIMPPGCDPVRVAPPLAGGERRLTTGMPRIDDTENTADIWYCSPATAAVAALKGVVTDPTGYVK